MTTAKTKVAATSVVSAPALLEPKPFEIGSVTDPQWVDAQQSAIRCIVTFPNHPWGVTHPLDYVAHPGDIEAHGRELFQRCAAGEFGKVAAYESPSDHVLATAARADRDRLISQTDWSQAADVPAETRELWQSYRQALRDITDQPGFPRAIKWPDPPAST